MMIKTGLLMIVALVFIGVSPSFAVGERLVLLPLQGKGLSISEKKMLQGAIKEGISKRYRIYSGERVSEKLKTFALSSCPSIECLEKIAMAFNANLVGRGYVERNENGYLLGIEIKDVSTGEDIFSSSWGCLRCDKAEILEKFKEMAQGKGDEKKYPGGVEYADLSSVSGSERARVIRLTPEVRGDDKSKGAALFFDSEPTGATVCLGDTVAGKTPYDNLSLKPGQTLRVTIQKEDYHSKTVALKLSGGTNELGTIPLKPMFGSLSITSTPLGAHVYIAGKKVGTTPYEAKRIRSGAYLVSIRKEFYIPVENSRVVVRDEENTEKRFNLKSDFGILKIDAAPPGARVTVKTRKDQTVARGRTPLRVKLSPEKYNVDIEKQGYRKLSYHVSLARDKTLNIGKKDAVLRKLEGELVVSSTPYVKGAAVYVNGRKRGRLPALFKMPVGFYQVEVRAGERSGKKRVRIEEGEIVTAKIELNDTTEKSFINSIGMEFVYIKPGTFMMGSPSSEPDRGWDEKQHQVTLTRGFYMQTTEVTQWQWKAVMGNNNPSGFKNYGDNRPVERVTWNEVGAYIKKLNQLEGEGRYRLPTEAQWEYAARAGRTTRYGWGDEADCSKMMHENAQGSKEDNCVGYFRRKGLPVDSTARVASFPPNPWGLYDMHGNVWEWCGDWFGDYPSGPVTDPVGPEKGSYRVCRGGGWDFFPGSCRSANRNSSSPGNRNDSLGFRLVRTP